VTRLPIADYALLSDCRSAALVSRGGSIDWLCYPRFDGPSVFGRILDDDAGHWSIRPPDGTPFETTRRYLEGTMVLETTFTTATGSVILTDALAVGRNERGHELGAGAVGAVLRRVVGVAGSVDLDLVYAPRPEYGLVSAGAGAGRWRGHRPRRCRRAGAVVAGAARGRRLHRPGPL
jgi:GH15 family glucan-1,4-alpha-glucosidase